MARGYPDFQSSQGFNDSREPTVALYHPPIWVHDNFESVTSKWYFRNADCSLLTGDCNSAGYGSSYNGNQFLEIKTQAGDYGEVRRWIGVPPTNYTLGISYLFNVEDKSDFEARDDSIQLAKFLFYTGTVVKVIWVAYDPSTGKFWINDNNSALNANVLTVDLKESAWHYFKITFNFATGKWDKLIIDDENVDLTDRDVYSTASTTGKKLQMYIIAYGDTGLQAKLAIDDFKITYNES